MNLILLFPEDFIAPDRVLLSGRRLLHIRQVHRAKAGDELRVGLAGGDIGLGRVARLDDTAAELSVCFEQRPPPPLAATLVLALPRPKVLRRVLGTATAMGVKRLVLLNALRVEKSFWQSPVLEPDALRENLILGLEQGCDTVLPEVLLRRRFRPFVEDELPEISAGTLALVGDPRATICCPRQVDGPVTLVVGPEGGFIPFETGLLEAAGVRPVHLGQRILRVEAAVPALLARLS